MGTCSAKSELKVTQFPEPHYKKSSNFRFHFNFFETVSHYTAQAGFKRRYIKTRYESHMPIITRLERLRQEDDIHTHDQPGLYGDTLSQKTHINNKALLWVYNSSLSTSDS